MQFVFDIADRGYIKFNKSDFKDSDNFYILDPATILELLTDSKWTVSIQPASYQPTSGDYVVQCYRYAYKTHFKMEDFDSLQNSRTVKYGYIDSFRIFRKVA